MRDRVCAVLESVEIKLWWLLLSSSNNSLLDSSHLISSQLSSHHRTSHRCSEKLSRRENQPIMDESNWRDQLQPETRRLILNNIMDQIKLGYHAGDHDEFLELQKIAQSVEQKSYAGATSQSDYLDKIASKMLLLQKAREREWRYQLQPESRQRIVNKIADTLRRYLPVSGPEGSQEMWRIAQRFEEKIFNAATSQSDYLRKISLKMLTMEAKPQRDLGQPSNQFGSDNEPANPVDANPRMQSSRSRRRPSWTRDYHMG